MQTKIKKDNNKPKHRLLLNVFVCLFWFFLFFFDHYMDTIMIYSQFDRFSCANTVLELKASGFIYPERGRGLNTVIGILQKRNRL